MGKKLKLLIATAIIAVYSVQPCLAVTKTQEEHNENPTQKIMRESLNDNSVKDLFKKYKVAATKEIYVKVYDSKEQEQLDPDKQTLFTTKKDYEKAREKHDMLEIKHENVTSRIVAKAYNPYDPEIVKVKPYNCGWIKLDMQAMVSNMNENDIAVSANFEWLKKPFFHKGDIFAIGHDSNSTFTDTSGSFTYMPSKARGEFSSNRQDFVHNNSNMAYSNGSLMGIRFPLIDLSVKSYNGSALTNVYDYNMSDGTYDLKGQPSGNLSVEGHKANRYNQYTQLSIFYAHQQYALDGNPSLSITNGGFSLGGAASIKSAYDSKQFHLEYKFGTVQVQA